MNHYNTRSVVSNQEDLPKNVRDDPSVNETLTLISEQDFNRFAYASDEIRCHSAEQILRDYWKRKRSINSFDESSVQLATPHFQQRNIAGHQNLIVNSNNNVINMTKYDDLIQKEQQHFEPKKNHIAKSIKKFSKFFILFALFCFITSGLSMFLIIENAKVIRQSKLSNDQKIVEMTMNSEQWNNRSTGVMQRFRIQVQMLKKRLTCFGFAQSKSTVPLHATRWETSGVTVAEFESDIDREVSGIGFRSLFVDEDQTVYIADPDNHHIIVWKAGAKTGEVLAGGKGGGDHLDQLENPTDVIFDRETDSLLICDSSNKRVVRWPRHPTSLHQSEIVIDKTNCFGFIMDDQGSLYISDEEKHEVRRYDRDGDKKGTVVAGGHGEGDNLNQLSWPTYLFIDDHSTLYVSDTYNHRVMKWMKGAQEGIVVAGGNGEGESLAQLSHPQGVWVDRCGHVHVVDEWNHRVMRWEKGAKQGTVSVGGNGEGARPNQLYNPEGLFVDLDGHLYVADTGNDRIQCFSLIID